MSLLTSSYDSTEWRELPIHHKIELYRMLMKRPSPSKAANWPLPSQLVNRKTGRSYRPNTPEKIAFHKSAKPLKALLGGFGAGKTSAGAIEAYKRIRAGEPGAIVSPDSNHFEKSAGEEFAAWFPWEHLADQNVQKKWWLFDTGSKVYYGGIDDPESWEGPNLNWVWFDEAARKRTRKAFDALFSRIRIGNNPQLFITTTPKPHWLQDILVTEPLTIDGEIYSDYWSISTASNQSNLDPLYYARLKASYTGKQAQQYLEGCFVGYEGAVYDNFSMEVWPAGNITRDEPLADLPFELAFDDGYRDPRAFLWIQRQADRILVCAELYHTKHLAHVCVDEATALCAEHKWPLPEVAIGSPEAAELREHLRLADIPAWFKVGNPIERINKLRALVCDGNGVRTIAVHPRCKNLIIEMTQKFSYAEEVKESRRSIEAPVWKDDHACQALDMWAWSRT